MGGGRVAGLPRLTAPDVRHGQARRPLVLRRSPSRADSTTGRQWRSCNNARGTWPWHSQVGGGWHRPAKMESNHGGRATCKHISWKHGMLLYHNTQGVTGTCVASLAGAHRAVSPSPAMIPRRFKHIDM